MSMKSVVSGEWTKHKVPRLRSAAPHCARDDSSYLLASCEGEDATSTSSGQVLATAGEMPALRNGLVGEAVGLADGADAHLAIDEVAAGIERLTVEFE